MPCQERTDSLYIMLYMSKRRTIQDYTLWGRCSMWMIMPFLTAIALLAVEKNVGKLLDVYVVTLALSEL